MINSKFIIRYTDGLYSAPAESTPRYDEFRDMFSSGQIKSKEWAVCALLPHLTNQSIVIAGAWFGTLGMMIAQKKPETKIILMDIDPRCETFINDISKYDDNISAITHDMYTYNYSESVVINTSCEHIPDLRAWLDLLPKGTTVLLQSNDNTKMDGHINCPTSVQDFKNKAKLETIFYSGDYIMPVYTRYMIIGQT